MYSSGVRTVDGCRQISHLSKHSNQRRCWSACPCQCRCKSPYSHHICSVGSCICYSNYGHLCGCRAAVCTPKKSVKFQNEPCHVAQSQPVDQERCSQSRSVDCTSSVSTKLLDNNSYRHAGTPPSKESAGDPKTFEHTELSSLLQRLWVLQTEIKGLLSGRSLREKVQIIGQQLDNREAIAKVNSSQDFGPTECKNAARIQGEMQLAEKFQPAPRHSKREHMLIKRPAMQEQHRATTKQQQNINQEEESGAENRQGVSDRKETMKILQLWKEYKCDLHLRRIIDSSRRAASCRMLEDMHTRLTYYMLQYIGSVAKGLMGDEKVQYLRFFKKEGPFSNKPLNEGTYAELLSFVSSQAKPAKDVVKALESAEEGLEDEAGREGYSPNAIGDIRAQMRAYLEAKQVGSSLLPVQDEDLTREFLQDVSMAADQSKLGSLQDSQKLIKLGCFLALKRLDFPMSDVSSNCCF